MQKTIVICFLQRTQIIANRHAKKQLVALAIVTKNERTPSCAPQKEVRIPICAKKNFQKKTYKKKHTRKNLQESVELSTGNTCKGHHLCRRLLLSLLGASLVLSSGLDRKGFRV